ncbi:ZmpA/ZmpB/ZmpC family metallo-endopeptidase [Streptococcus pneumoniae]|uniref:ZmpA/ZmpB/ZmpC family metallo-endopeptidase n=1 Tax=Streptococcus pneumoniae TaxID=1313 RepID=UPI0007654B89|nr:ZmpA/ZmpB/ZmpC family metallo-endopeptidase [Streptococcus pneumoniae]CVN08763.1 ribonuclease HII [Streptococcus pneumoniae]
MATIKEIKELLVTVKELESPIFLELEKDNRSGVQKEISKRKRAIQKLKRAIFKAYLDQTNDFRSSIFENKK